MKWYYIALIIYAVSIAINLYLYRKTEHNYPEWFGVVVLALSPIVVIMIPIEYIKKVIKNAITRMVIRKVQKKLKNGMEEKGRI